MRRLFCTKQPDEAQSGLEIGCHNMHFCNKNSLDDVDPSLAGKEKIGLEPMTKPWTVSRGPIVASQIDIQKADAINALLVCPVGILPARPGDPIRPFAIGLFEEIRLLLKPGVGMTTLRRAVAAFVHSKRYYFASAQPNSVRHDLDGRPLEALSEDDRMTAQNRFLGLKQKTTGGERNSEPSSPSPSSTSGATKSEQIRASLLGRGKMQRTSSISS